MKRIFLILILLIGTLTGQAQFWKTKISGNGHIVTEERKIAHFDKLTVTGPFKVKIIEGKSPVIKLTTDENLINIIDTYVKSGKLIIRINPDFSIKKYTKLKVVVPSQYLSKITLTGSGSVYNEKPFDWHNLSLTLTGSGDIDLISQVNHIEVVITGSGSVQLQGSSDRLKASITGSGELLAKDLAAKDAKVTITGSGEAYVQCSTHLTAKVFGSGNLYYFGEPQFLKTKVFGSGAIHLHQ